MGIKVSFSEKGSLSLQSEILIRMYILKRKLIRNALYALYFILLTYRTLKFQHLAGIGAMGGGDCKGALTVLPPWPS